ncbi:hypothetical protein WJX73_002742 [Symbiochloris irregularis]|uniref:Small-subunit processome Utp12 domain-containing protein n=1 Tax=Symbiochloris irregularis TaxID=706552 RepID=A0AAW1PAD3_9CHLO
MVKAYLRYEAASTFGVITSSISICHASNEGQLLTAALESVLFWNLRQGTQVRALAPPAPQNGGVPGEVCRLLCSPSGDQLAVGHTDGNLRVWNLEQGTCDVTLRGHKGSISALRFSRGGATLASGGRDTDIVMWDLPGEAGLYRLQGHTNEVTDVAFVERENTLVSGSKDGSLRVWDLTTQHCYQTILLSQAEVWSLDVNPEEARLAVGTNLPQLLFYSITARSKDPLPFASGSRQRSTPQDDSAAAQDESSRSTALLKELGAVQRRANERVAHLRYCMGGGSVAVQAAGKQLELFRVRPDADVRQHVRRRRKRKRDKDAKAGDSVLPAAGDAAMIDPNSAEARSGAEASTSADVEAGDEIAPWQVVRCKHKIRAFSEAPRPRKGKLMSLALALANNMVEIWDIDEEAVAVQSTLEGAGHRGGIRAVALSSDDSLILSAAAEGVKLWNSSSGACIRTLLEPQHALCALFAPGNRHAVVGCKDGTLNILDLGAASITSTMTQHQGPVWGLVPLPDLSGFVSCSADHSLKFWEWEVVKGGTVEAEGAAAVQKRLGVNLARKHEVTDDALCVRVSADGRLIAVALLDSTIQVYFLDTMKFFLALYGHKLPVLSMDMSSDGTLLASGSADKNLKIWGLDFGDCHRSLFAHDDSVMQVAFVRDTHYVFTAGKDGTLKYWDADRWELLLTLEGHRGEAWALALSSLGDFVVTGGADRSLRRWERTEEPFFAEEERERRLESLFEADVEEGPAAREGNQIAAATAGRKTGETVGAADALMDALELSAHETQRLQEDTNTANGDAAMTKPPQANPLMEGLPPGDYVLRALKRVKAAELEQALLMLPFADALNLLTYLPSWLAHGSQVELGVRVAVLLVRLHHGRLAATPSCRSLLLQVQGALRGSAQQLKSTMGFNLAALSFLQRRLREERGAAAQPSAMAW